MTEATKERVGAVLLSGAREGEIVLLDPEVVAAAESTADQAALGSLGEALDHLNAVLDRFIAAVRASADEYAAAADRLEQDE
jgi:hypothetical protein